MDNNLKSFKLRISKGYHKVSNAYIKVSAPDASEGRCFFTQPS
jgi:hypothetical protein